MKIEIRNLPDVQRMLGELASTQLPYALSVTINKTLFRLLEESKQRIQTVFDRPTPGIVKSTRVERSSKQNLRAAILIAPWRTSVMGVHERGGQRDQTTFEKKLRLPENWFAVPTKNMPLNQYGNPVITKKQQIAKARAGLLTGTRRQFLFIMPSEIGFDVVAGRLSPGVYETKSGSYELTKLYHFIKKVEYKPILKWEETMYDKAEKFLPEEAEKAVEIAIRTARR